MSRASNPKEKWFLYLFHEFCAMICTHLSRVLYQFGKYDFRSSLLWFLLYNINYFIENHKIINGNATNFLTNKYQKNYRTVSYSECITYVDLIHDQIFSTYFMFFLKSQQEWSW